MGHISITVAILAEAGAEPRHLVRLTWFVTDKHEYLQNLPGVGAVYREVIGRRFPAMSLLQVVALVEDRAEVEIEATAVLPWPGGGRGESSMTRSVHDNQVPREIDPETRLPIGPRMADSGPARPPERIPIEGRYARLEPLDPARHRDELYAASTSRWPSERGTAG